MRSDGLWHAELIGHLVGLRHTEMLVIADAGLSVPVDVPVIDLGWRRGSPRVREVLPAVLAELDVERASLAKELTDETLRSFFADVIAPAPIDSVTHDDLKVMTSESRIVVRTGDDLPYANIVLHAGVPFGGAR